MRLTLLATLLATAATAQELNLYSSRHYDTDERLYSEFTEATGIRINRIEGNADELIARMRAEGRNSPADVLLTVDTSRLHRAAEAGVLQPVESAVLAERIPAALRSDDNLWFGFSTRARIVFYDPEVVAEPPLTYEALADPAYAGLICMRSATNVYSQTLLSAVIEAAGEEAAEAWAAGLLANLARDPQGGDTDQLRGLASGECGIAISNTYYFARALRREVDGLSDATDRIAWVFPNQDGRGAHLNISGGGMAAHAPNPDAAVAFLEYLTTEAAQRYFAEGNDEYPAVTGVPLAASVARLGDFKADPVDLSAVAENLPAAQAIYNRTGWE